MIIPSALAQTASSAPEGGLLATVVPFVLIFVIFYFLIIRPQSKKIKQHRKMTEALKTGDEIITQGGLIGKIKKTAKKDEEDGYISLELGDGIVVKALRETISQKVERE